MALTGRSTKRVRVRAARQLSPCRDALAAFGAPGRRLVGIAAEAAVGDHLDLGQQRGQGAGRGGLGRAALAADQHAADLRIDGVQDQGALHALLADDGGKGKIGGIVILQ